MEKGIKNCNNAKHEENYNALMYNTKRIVDESRIQKVSDNIPKSKTSKVSLNTFDVKVNNIKSHLHNENLYLFKRDLINKINATSLELDKEQLANNILDLSISDDRELIKAVIKLNNEP